MKTISKSYRLPKELVDQLGYLAKETDCSQDLLVEMAIREYFKQDEDCIIAQVRLSHPRIKIVSSPQMRTRLKL